MYVHVRTYIYICISIHWQISHVRLAWNHGAMNRVPCPGPISPEVQLGTRPLVTCRVLSVDLWESHYVWVYDGNEERHVDDNFGWIVRANNDDNFGWICWDAPHNCTVEVFGCRKETNPTRIVMQWIMADIPNQLSSFERTRATCSTPQF